MGYNKEFIEGAKKLREQVNAIQWGDPEDITERVVEILHIVGRLKQINQPLSEEQVKQNLKDAASSLELNTRTPDRIHAMLSTIPIHIKAILIDLGMLEHLRH